MIIYLPEERIGSDETMAKLVDLLNDQREANGVDMSADTRPEVTPGPRTWNELVDELPTASVTLTGELDLASVGMPVEIDDSCSGPVVTMTPAARDESEGATMRRELARGVCQSTWRNYPHVNIREDPTRYRQHRCGRDHEHRGACRCRYCGRDKASA